jgi:hypothetical protein
MIATPPYLKTFAGDKISPSLLFGRPTTGHP